MIEIFDSAFSIAASIAGVIAVLWALPEEGLKKIWCLSSTRYGRLL